MTRSDQAQLLQRKAAQDLAVLDRLLDDDAIDDETLGYHAQQAAEKHLSLREQPFRACGSKVAEGRIIVINEILDELTSRGVMDPARLEEHLPPARPEQNGSDGSASSLNDSRSSSASRPFT